MLLLLLEKNKGWLYKIGSITGGIIFGLQIIKAIISINHNLMIIPIPFAMVLSFFGFIILYFILILNWKLILSIFGIEKSLVDITKGYFISFIPRYIPGSVWGYFSRSEWLYQDFRIPHYVTHLSSIIEIIVYLITPLLLLLDYIFFNKIIGVCSLVLVISLILVTSVLSKESRGNSFLKKMELISLKRKSKNEPLIIGIALFYWLLSGIVVTMLGFALFPDTIKFSSWQLITLLYSIAWVIGFLTPFIPAGIGVREVALTQLLISFLSLNQNQAVVIAVLTRLFALVVEGIWLLIGLILNNTTK